MSIDYKDFQVTVTLTTDMLGTIPKNKELYTDFIAGKARESLAKMEAKGIPMADGQPATSAAVAEAIAEETESIKDMEDKGWTGFFEDSEGPYIMNYFVKGFLCESARTLKEIDSVKQMHDKVKRYCFITPRRIRLPPIAGNLERPIRAQTPQGPRVALVRSDFIAESGEFTFKMRLLDAGKLTAKIMQDVLEYGEYMGFGQWRSGGWGQFLYRMERLD